MGPKLRREQELKERKKLILEKSKELFFKHGYDNVTIQNICEAVEYGKSVIYSMFESKEDIYSHIYLDALEIIRDLNESIDPEAKNFDKEFMKAALNIYTFYRDYRNYYMAIAYFSTNSMAHSKIPEVIMEQKEKLAENASLKFAVLLGRGIETGYLVKFDIVEFIKIFFSSLIGIIGVFIWTEQEEDEEKIRSYCITHGNLYLQGLKKIK